MQSPLKSCGLLLLSVSRQSRTGSLHDRQLTPLCTLTIPSEWGFLCFERCHAVFMIYSFSIINLLGCSSMSYQSDLTFSEALHCHSCYRHACDRPGLCHSSSLHSIQNQPEPVLFSVGGMGLFLPVLSFQLLLFALHFLAQISGIQFKPTLKVQRQCNTGGVAHGFLNNWGIVSLLCFPLFSGFEIIQLFCLSCTCRDIIFP